MFVCLFVCLGRQSLFVYVVVVMFACYGYKYSYLREWNDIQIYKNIKICFLNKNNLFSVLFTFF